MDDPGRDLEAVIVIGNVPLPRVGGALSARYRQYTRWSVV